MHEKRWQVVLDSKQNMAPPRNTKNGHLVMCFFNEQSSGSVPEKQLGSRQLANSSGRCK